MTRSLPDPGFPGDDGAADPALAAALARPAGDPAREPEVLAALARSRLLVAVTAVATAEETAAGGLRRDKATDMALVLLEGTDGRRALPVFSALATLAQWDPAARPVPVEAARAAQSALVEGAAVLVLDVAGPAPVQVGGPALRRLAEGDPLLPLYADPAVAAAVAALLDREPAVLAGWLVPAAGADARLLLSVADPQDTAFAAGLARRVAEGLRRSDAVRRAVVRGVDLALAPAGLQPAPDPVFRRCVPG